MTILAHPVNGPELTSNNLANNLIALLGRLMPDLENSENPGLAVFAFSSVEVGKSIRF